VIPSSQSQKKTRDRKGRAAHLPKSLICERAQVIMITKASPANESRMWPALHEHKGQRPTDPPKRKPVPAKSASLDLAQSHPKHIWATWNPVQMHQEVHKYYADILEVSEYIKQHLSQESHLKIKLFNFWTSNFFQLALNATNHTQTTQNDAKFYVQVINHDTNLFQGSESLTNIDNTKVYCKPHLGNSKTFKTPTFNNMLWNAPASHETRSEYTPKSKIIIRTYWNLKILVLRLFTHSLDSSQTWPP